MQRQRLWILLGAAAIAVVVVFVMASTGDEAPGSATVGLDPMLGSGSVTVFLFEDYQCPHCRDYALSPEYEALLSRWVETDRIQLVFKHVAFVGPYSEGAALASRCVFEASPAAWSAWDHAVYEDQTPDDYTAPTTAHLRALAQEHGVATAAYDACMAEPERLREALQDNRRELVELGKGTPTLLVDGRTFNPAAQAQAVDAAIEAAVDAEAPGAER